LGLRQVTENGMTEIVSKVSALLEVLDNAGQLQKSGWKIFRPQRGSGIRFLMPQNSDFSAKRMVQDFRAQHGIALSAYDEPPVGIRICVSHQNTKKDLERLIDALCVYSSNFDGHRGGKSPTGRCGKRRALA
jgi:selenocysteine lyase/cysteine desulfurase